MAVIRQTGVVGVAFSWPEANQALAGLQTRAVLLETFLLDGKMSAETHAYIAAAYVDTKAAEGRLSAALMGDPSLADGDHFAGMPSPSSGYYDRDVEPS